METNSKANGKQKTAFALLAPQLAAVRGGACQSCQKFAEMLAKLV
jgi:hypothetical protein